MSVETKLIAFIGSRIAMHSEVSLRSDKPRPSTIAKLEEANLIFQEAQRIRKLELALKRKAAKRASQSTGGDA